MASPTTLDFETLLRPISDEQPSGVELRADSEGRTLFFQVKEAREAARNIERRSLHGLLDEEEAAAPIERPDWQIVRQLATDVLTNHSKDLWICAWLIEALTRLEGFAGLRDGFRLTREIADTYWDSIHPEPDEDGYATTVAQLVGLNGEDADGALIAPIDHVPIVCETSVLPLTSAHYRDAVELNKVTDPDQRERRLQQGAVTLDIFEKAVREAPTEYYENLIEDVSEAEDEFARMNEVLEARCGTDDSGYSIAPPSSNIRSALADVHSRILSIARAHLGKSDAVAESSNELMTEPMAGDAPAINVNAVVYNREDAFRALLKVADFFHRTEPHSPVSYALEQAVRWGRMSLPDLMRDLISDDSARHEMFKRLGINDSNSSTED